MPKGSDKAVFLVAVVDHDREHSAEHLDEVRAVFPVEGDDNLDLGVGMELDSLFQQRFSEVAVVIDLTVKDCGKASIGRGIGLRAGIKVDDRETSESGAEAVADDKVAFIRAAVADGVRHRRQEFFII